MKSWRRIISDYFFESGNYKLVAAAIAFALWATVLVRRDVVYIKNVPLNYVLSDTQALGGEMPEEIEVRLAGTRAMLKRFNSRAPIPISIDVTNLTNGIHTISIPEDALQLPVGIRIVRITPSSVQVRLASTILKEVPVIMPNFPPELSGRVQLVGTQPEKVGIRIDQKRDDEFKNVIAESIGVTAEAMALFEKKSPGETIEILGHVHAQPGVRVVNLGPKQTIVLTLKKL